MLIVWTLREKILRTALCSVAYNSLNSDICRNEQCLKFVGWLGSDFVFVHLLWFNITCVFCVSLEPFCLCIACFFTTLVVNFLHYQAKTLVAKNICKLAFFVLKS